MKKSENLEIIQRLLILAKNDLKYDIFPKSYKEEYVFLSNVLNDSIKQQENEFKNLFGQAVGQFKSKGWFNSPEKLIWCRMQINQLIYAVYGEDYVHELIFKEELGKEAYRDLIEQIDRTVLMSPDELEKHNSEINKIASEIIDEIIAEEKNEKSI